MQQSLTNEMDVKRTLYLNARAEAASARPALVKRVFGSSWWEHRCVPKNRQRDTTHQGDEGEGALVILGTSGEVGGQSCSVEEPSQAIDDP